MSEHKVSIHFDRDSRETFSRLLRGLPLASAVHCGDEDRVGGSLAVGVHCGDEDRVGGSLAVGVHCGDE